MIIFAQQTPPNHNNRSRAAGGVWERLTGMKKLLLKIIIVIACVVGFAYGGAFIGLEAYDRHLIGRHYHGFFPGLGEALLGLCIGAIIGGVVGYKIIKPKSADLLRKHGGKTGAELKAEGK